MINGSMTSLARTPRGVLISKAAAPYVGGRVWKAALHAAFEMGPPSGDLREGDEKFGRLGHSYRVPLHFHPSDRPESIRWLPLREEVSAWAPRGTTPEDYRLRAYRTGRCPSGPVGSDWFVSYEPTAEWEQWERGVAAARLAVAIQSDGAYPVPEWVAVFGPLTQESCSPGWPGDFDRARAFGQGTPLRPLPPGEHYAIPLPYGGGVIEKELVQCLQGLPPWEAAGLDARFPRPWWGGIPLLGEEGQLAWALRPRQDLRPVLRLRFGGERR